MLVERQSGGLNKVLDSSAMIAYLRGEPGGSDVDAMLTAPETVCYAHVLNLCELYYLYARSQGQPVALSVLADLDAAGVIFRDDLDTPFWQAVGDLKAGGGIALPDCFCVALSVRLGAEAVTADRGEFTAVLAAGVCPVYFIR